MSHARALPPPPPRWTPSGRLLKELLENNATGPAQGASGTSEAALRDILRDGVCTRELGSGAYATVYRACQHGPATHGGGPPCSECVAIKRQKNPGKNAAASVYEAEMLAAVRAALTRDRHHAHHHVLRVRAVVRDVAFSRAVLMDEVQPLPALGASTGASTLHAWARTSGVSDAAWRAAWFQLLGTLATLQATLPGFQHNDLHAKNVLVSPGGAAHGACTFLGRTLARPPPVSVTLVDFGLSTRRPAFRTGQPLPPLPAGVRALVKHDLANCALADVFRAAAGIYHDVHTPATTTATAAAAAAAAAAPARLRRPWAAPWCAFMLRVLGATALAAPRDHCGHLAAGSAALADLRARSAALRAGLATLLDDAYFQPVLVGGTGELVDDAGDTADDDTNGAMSNTRPRAHGARWVRWDVVPCNVQPLGSRPLPSLTPVRPRGLRRGGRR